MRTDSGSGSGSAGGLTTWIVSGRAWVWTARTAELNVQLARDMPLTCVITLPAKNKAQRRFVRACLARLLLSSLSTIRARSFQSALDL